MSRSKITSSSIDTTVATAASVSGVLTKSSSNPAYNTNGSVGDVWVNTTNGEIFVCSDNTSNKNHWINQADGKDLAPDLTNLAASVDLSAAFTSSQSLTVSFSGATDPNYSTFDWSVGSISNTNVCSSISNSSVTNVASGAFSITAGSTTDTDATFVITATNDDGFQTSKTFTMSVNAYLTTIGFYDGDNWSVNSHAGAGDSVTRSAGEATSFSGVYQGVSLDRPLDGDYNHILILRAIASGDAYAGLGFSHKSTITDSEAQYNFGTFHGNFDPLSSATTKVTYFNSTSDRPPANATDFYIYCFTKGSGSSRTFNMTYNTSLSTVASTYEAYNKVYNASDNSASGGLTAAILPWTIGTDDVAIWLGEAGSLHTWRIEYYRAEAT